MKRTPLGTRRKPHLRKRMKRSILGNGHSCSKQFADSAAENIMTVSSENEDVVINGSDSASASEFEAESGSSDAAASEGSNDCCTARRHSVVHSPTKQTDSYRGAQRQDPAEEGQSKSEENGQFRLLSFEETIATQRRKGDHVLRQRRLLAELLSLRIRFNPLLRLSNRMPPAAVYNLFLQSSATNIALTQQQQQQQDELRGSVDATPSATEKELDLVRQEAAALFLDLLNLQRQLSKQNSLNAAAAGAEVESESNSEAERTVGTEAEGQAEDSWISRRRRWRSQHNKNVVNAEERDQRDSQGFEDENEKADLETRSSCNNDSSSPCKTAIQLFRGESRTWRNLADTFWRRHARGPCLAGADAWHAALDPQAQSFKILKQSPSRQLADAMKSQYERLLRRALRSSHMTPLSSANPSGLAAAANSKLTSSHIEGAVVPCDMVGCQAMQQLSFWLLQQQKQPCQQQSIIETGAVNGDIFLKDHVYYEDSDFYVELLKEVVKQGLGATVLRDDACSEIFGRERNLLKLRNELNRRRQDVDRKASKGRKLRYQAIPKLQNFLTATPWEPITEALPGTAAATTDALSLINQLTAQLFAD